jgi:hypothetical protein
MSEVLDNERLALLATGLLADAAFVFAEPSTAFTPQKAPLATARIALICPRPLELLVIAEGELAKALAANLLGIEEDSEEAETSAGAALGEWANMLAGSLAAEHMVDSGPARIGIPSITTASVAVAGVALGKAVRRANLVTETGQHMVVALRPLEAA